MILFGEIFNIINAEEKSKCAICFLYLILLVKLWYSVTKISVAPGNNLGFSCGPQGGIIAHPCIR